MRPTVLFFALALASRANAAQLSQTQFGVDARYRQTPIGHDHPGCLPRIDYAALGVDEATEVPAPEEMVLYKLHVSGNWSDRVDLTFFSDGCELVDPVHRCSAAESRR